MVILKANQIGDNYNTYRLGVNQLHLRKQTSSPGWVTYCHNSLTPSQYYLVLYCK